jgi:hypothetical protein
VRLDYRGTEWLDLWRSLMRSIARPVAPPLVPKRVLRIDTTVGVCTRRSPHTLLICGELAITWIPPCSSLQTVAILYLVSRHGRRSHASTRETWARDPKKSGNQKACEQNLAHKITSHAPRGEVSQII